MRDFESKKTQTLEGQAFLQGQFHHARIRIEDGIIASIEVSQMKSSSDIHLLHEEAYGSAYDHTSRNLSSQPYILPGLVDVHTHGGFGVDFCRAMLDADYDSIRRWETYEKSVGVTSIIPSTMTLPISDLCTILSNTAAYLNSNPDSIIRGVHLEGPFVNPAKCGAQGVENAILPNPDSNSKSEAMDLLLSAWNRTCPSLADGDVRMQSSDSFDTHMQSSDILGTRMQSSVIPNTRILYMTLAPELPGCTELIRAYSDRVQFSIGHTNCSYLEATSAFSHGAVKLTHLYNAMPSLHHRNPGPIGAAFDQKKYAELICDGHHVDPAMVRLAFRMFGQKLILISDSTMATGMPDGHYMLGAKPIIKEGTRAIVGTPSSRDMLTGTPSSSNYLTTGTNDKSKYLSAGTDDKSKYLTTGTSDKSKYLTAGTDDKNKKDATLAGSVSNLYDCMLQAISCEIRMEDAIHAATYAPAASGNMLKQCGQIRIGAPADLLILNPDLSIQTTIHSC